MFTKLLLPSSQRVATLLVLLGLIAATPVVRADGSTRFLVDYSSQPTDGTGFAQVILDPYSAHNLAKENAPASFAYLSLVEVSSTATYADATYSTSGKATNTSSGYFEGLIGVDITL